MRPCCTGYSPASAWLQDPKCCCSKEDPEISDIFQPPALQKYLPAAKSLQESLRNKMAIKIWSLEVRSDSPEEQKEKTPSPRDGKQNLLQDAWSGVTWKCRSALHFLLLPLATPGSTATSPRAVERCQAVQREEGN